MLALFRIIFVYLLFLGAIYQLNLLYEIGVLLLILSLYPLIQMVLFIRALKKSGDKTGGCALEIVMIATVFLIVTGAILLTMDYFIF